MSTIRRTYAYLLAFAGLAMLSVAAANLGQLLVDVLSQAPLASNAQFVRNQVALNAAAALVGLPVWLLHWLWIERMARGADVERASTLRRLYLYAVLTGAVWVLASASRDALVAVLAALTATTSGQSTVALVVRQLPFIVVASVVWTAHWRIASRDRALVGESGGSATLRRWYLYGAAFVGLVILLVGASGLLETLWRLVTTPPAAGASFGLAAPMADTLVGAALWLLHWQVLPRRLTPDAARDDGVAVLRSVYLFLALSLGVAGTMFGISQLLYYALARLLGLGAPGGVSGDLLQAAAGPASLALVYGANWAYQRQALQDQAQVFEEAPRQAGIRRLYTYVVALIALGAVATGVAGLLWALGDLLFNSTAAVGTDLWRGQVALYATLIVVGLPVWLLHWRPVPGSEADVRSLSRRLYLYLALIGAMLVLVGSAAAVLYRVISLVLGEGSSVSLFIDLSHALALAIVAAVVAAYHWRVLRADAAAAPQPAAPLPTDGVAQMVVQLRAADAASLEQALAALRATGVDVVVMGAS